MVAATAGSIRGNRTRYAIGDNGVQLRANTWDTFVTVDLGPNGAGRIEVRRDGKTLRSYNIPTENPDGSIRGRPKTLSSRGFGYYYGEKEILEARKKERTPEYQICKSCRKFMRHHDIAKWKMDIGRWRLIDWRLPSNPLMAERPLYDDDFIRHNPNSPAPKRLQKCWARLAGEKGRLGKPSPEDTTCGECGQKDYQHTLACGRLPKPAEYTGTFCNGCKGRTYSPNADYCPSCLGIEGLEDES